MTGVEIEVEVLLVDFSFLDFLCCFERAGVSPLSNNEMEF